MALLKCPECNKKISSAANACPHCGFPLSPSQSDGGVPLPPSKKTSSSPKSCLGCLTFVVLAFVGLIGYGWYLGEQERKRYEAMTPEQKAAFDEQKRQKGIEEAKRNAQKKAQKDQEDQYDKEEVWKSRGIEAARAKLKDPESAEFKDVYFHRGKDGIPATCGTVNSKNGFGGFTGYQHFISAGSPDLTFLEEIGRAHV